MGGKPNTSTGIDVDCPCELLKTYTVRTNRNRSPANTLGAKATTGATAASSPATTLRTGTVFAPRERGRSRAGRALCPKLPCDLDPKLVCRSTPSL